MESIKAAISILLSITWDIRVFLIATVLTCASAVHADDVLIVVSSGSPQYTAAAQSCAQRLEQGGYETRTTEIGSFDTDGLDSDVTVVAIGAKAAIGVGKLASADISIVYALVPQPEQVGLTMRPNTSGISSDVPAEVQIDLMSEAVPGARTIGMLFSSESTISLGILDDSRSSESRIVAVDTQDHESPIDAIRTMFAQGIDVVWTVADPKVYDRSNVKSLLIESIKNRVPVFGFSASLVRAGAAIGISINPIRQGRRAADLVLGNIENTHLHADPDIVLNDIVAERIDHEFPRPLVSRASVVIVD